MKTIIPDAPGQSSESATKRSPARTFLNRYLRPAIMLTLLLTILTGLIYPGIVTGLAQLIFPYQANGSLVPVNGKVIGSAIIGQYWTSLKYFHGRPSATVNLQGTPSPYEADNSSASNLGPTSKALVQDVQQRVSALRAEFKQEGLAVPAGPVPVDLVTTSASGLDPDITIAAALYQAPIVAKARGLSLSVVRQLVMDYVHGRFLFIFGEPYVNVLELNIALDALK